MDHSMGFLINRCIDKEHLITPYGQPCPSPPPSTELEPDINDINWRGRAERNFETTTNALLPESGSITSSGQRSRVSALIVVITFAFTLLN